MKPSILRALAAMYLDLLLVFTSLNLVSPIVPIRGFFWPLVIVVWLCFELVIWRLGARSFGYYAMGMTRTDDQDILLEPDLKAVAHWLILVLGAMELYGGLGQFGHGLVDYRFYYFLGHRIERPGSIFVLFCIGMSGVLCTVGLCRCKRYAPVLVVGLQLFVVTNDATSIPVFQEMAERFYGTWRPAGSDISLDMQAEFFVAYRIVWNFLYLVFIIAVISVFRKRFVFKGLL